MFNLHRKYLLSKINYMIILFIILVTLLVYFVLFNPFNNSYTHWLNKQESIKTSIDNIVFINKFIFVLIGSFLFGNSFSLQQDAYNVIFLRTKKDKVNFYITKILSIISIIAFIFVILCFSNLFLFNYKINYYSNIKDLVLINFESFLLALVYGSISIILILIFKTQLVLIVPLILFFISDGLNWSFLKIYFPSIRSIVTFDGFIHKILLYCFYSTLGGIIYFYKDL